MHLWSEDEEKYLLLTQLQECEFTYKKTLVLVASTRLIDMEDQEKMRWYYDSYKIISKFAKENECVGMFCYSDLDYFAEMAKTTKEWSNVITRYQFYFPL